MVGETMFRTMMHNSHKYTSLKLSRKVSLKLTKLNPFCKYFYTVNRDWCYGVAMLKYSYQCADFLTLMYIKE